MKHKIWKILFTLALVLLSSSVAIAIAADKAAPDLAKAQIIQEENDPANRVAANTAVAYTTVITINTTVDTSGEYQNRTCYYDSYVSDGTGTYYPPSSDSLCNLRRALVEASHRPEDDRPILIKFNIPTTDTNYNPITGTWTIVMDADYSSSAGGEAIVPSDLDNPENTDSYITIDGDTQGEIGGRTNGAPIIIINSEHSFDLVKVSYNTIRNLAFNGGGGILLNDVSGIGGDNLVENVWVGLNADGTEIVPGSNPDISLAGGGITIQGDGNTISGTIVTGSNTGISVQGSDNVIQYNHIGTRGNKTIPAGRLTCVASSLYNPAQWYGGWGISISSGSNNQIIYNTIAGAHSPHSPTETAPPAIWTGGVNTLVAHNTIGIDGVAAEVGTCGQGIFVTGQGIHVLTNTIANARTSFFDAQSEDPTEGAIFINDGSPLALQFTVRNNIVRDSTSMVIEYGSAIPEALRLFDPPRIVTISGTLVVGETQVGSDCPNCLVELYLDDLDDEQDALELLKTAVIDNVAGTARFTATLDAPLPANHGIRVLATTQDDNIIADYWAGTTVMMSPAYAPDATFVRDLAPGWNLFSIDVVPPDPDITQVLSSLAGQYDLVLAFDGGPSGGGSTYDPGNPGASDLTTIDVEHGYWISITAATTQTLTLDYEPVRDDTAIQLYEGWNLISYLPDRTLSITKALESISGQYDMVRGFDGTAKTYMPGQPVFSDLTVLEPGYAYWIKISEGAGAPILNYAGADTPVMLLREAETGGPPTAPAAPGTTESIQSSDFFSPTTEWVDFYGVASLSGFSAPHNASVIAYDPDGVVAGAFTVHTPGYYGFLHVYVDDPNTPGDEGIQDGDEVRFTVNGRLAAPSKSTVWSSDFDAKEVNLEVTIPFVATDQWSDFWGTLTINGNPAPVGTIVAAYDPDGVYIGDFILTEAGQYGFLHAYGDDSDTAGDEGAEMGDIISFKAYLPLSTAPFLLTYTVGTPTWKGRGSRSEINLSSSGDPVSNAPSAVNFDGPSVGGPGVGYTFTISVNPIDVTMPLTYVIQRTDLVTPVTGLLGRVINYTNVAWATTGVKTITVTAENSSGIVTGTHTITISTVAPAAVNITGPAIGVMNVNYTFTITVDPIDVTTPLTYVIRRTDSATPVTGQLGRAINYTNVAWATPGTKAITVTATNEAGIMTGTHTIMVTDGSIISVTGVTIAGPTEGDVDTAYTFTATVQPGDAAEPVAYTWSPEPDSGQGTVYATYTWGVAGAQQITVTATNDGGSAQDTHDITISEPPLPGAPTDVIITGPTTGRTTGSYAFTVTVDPPDVVLPLTYTLDYTDKGGPPSTMQLNNRIIPLPNRSWSTPGPKVITVTATNDAGSVTGTHTILIAKVFVAGPAGKTLIFTDTSGLRTTIEIPSGALSGTTGFVYTPTVTISHPLASGFGFFGHSFGLDATRQISGQITITLEYRDQDWMDAGIEDESTLRLYYWNAGLDDWDDVANACGPPVPVYGPNVDLNYLAAPVCHLSKFAMLGESSEENMIYLPLVLKNK
ncbi:MAG: hypothetical protein GY832_19680 [Chloroflexi bacterium]|nr:hypothetical protein [Chloroflexota bacterium]